jgi:glucokinase
MTPALFNPPTALPAGTAPAACVDVGGTKIAVTLATTHGLLGKTVEPTVKEGPQDALGQQILRLIAESCAAAGVPLSDINKVAVSSCGPFIKTAQGIELAAPNICGGIAGKARGLPNDWPSAILEAPLRRAFQHVRVANDGVGALEAERRWGALQEGGRPLDHCAYVTWSTGIGVGLCVDGVVLQGKNGNAGHAGHTYVNSDTTALCGCGNVGDVEGLIAGNAIPRRFAAQGFSDAHALFTACAAGDAAALAIVDELCSIMGRLLYNLIASTDISRISLGGSVFWHNQDLLLPRLRHHALAPLPSLTQGVTLVPAGLGEAVGDYAALALALV